MGCRSGGGGITCGVPSGIVDIPEGSGGGKASETSTPSWRNSAGGTGGGGGGGRGGTDDVNSNHSSVKKAQLD